MKKLAFAILLFTSIAAQGQTSNPESKDQTDAASPAKKTAVQNSATPPKRIYIEPYFFTPGAVASSTGNVAVAAGLPARNLALEATKGFVKSCPLVAATDNREAADYVLKISPGSSVLYKQNGDVAYISPAKRRVSNLVKDVCDYVKEH